MQHAIPEQVSRGSRVRARFLALCALAVTTAWGPFEGLLKPDVPSLAVQDLLDAMDARGVPVQSASDHKSLLLVDVRDQRESAVSMLPGAITRADFEARRASYRNHRIVPYCTVGYRSAHYTQELIREGLDAMNFDGSIMAWVEAGLPLVTPSGEPTVRVHTWSRAIEAPPGYVQVVD